MRRVAGGPGLPGHAPSCSDGHGGAETMGRRLMGAAVDPPVRADARRNIERILDRAAHELAEDAASGMAEIARASGVGRATLYRHFPTRARLIDAIRDRAFAETERAIAASRLEEGTVTQAMGRLIEALLDVGDRYRVLTDEARARPDDPRRAREQELAVPLYALVQRGHDSGELPAAVPAQWALAVLRAVLVTAIQLVAEGAITREQAPALVTETLLDGLGPGSPGAAR